MRAAEAAGPPVTSLLGFDAETVRESPAISIQLNALFHRSVLNVARDPYLAALHVLLTVCVGVVVGSLFRDLSRLNGCTAGVQVRVQQLGWGGSKRLSGGAEKETERGSRTTAMLVVTPGLGRLVE